MVNFINYVKQVLRGNQFYRLYCQQWINDIRYVFRNYRIKKQYYNSYDKLLTKGNLLFFVQDPKQRHPGFADRLKVFCCLGYIAHANGFRLKLVVDENFPISKYLEPVNEDWRASWGDLCFNSKYSKLISYNGGRSKVPYLNKKISQYHVWNYIGLDMLCYKEKLNWQKIWKNTYDQLFRKTSYLDNILNSFDTFPPRSYVAVHLRFVNALDRLEDGYSNELSVIDQNKLIKKCLDGLSFIQKKYDTKLLVFSDSERFVNICKNKGFDTIEGGKIGHVSFDNTAFEKTIIDFFMLGRAKEIVRFNCRELYESTFPIYASFVGECRFKEYNLDTGRFLSDGDFLRHMINRE